MNHHCGTQLVITHSCRFTQVTWCPTCRRVKEQPKRLPGGARTLGRHLWLRVVGAIYRANKDDGMKLRTAVDIAEAAYPRHDCHRQRHNAVTGRLGGI